MFRATGPIRRPRSDPSPQRPPAKELPARALRAKEFCPVARSDASQKRLPLALCAGTLLAVLLAGCSSQSSVSPIYFGHLAPRSGPQREYGLGAEKAILLAVEQWRAAEAPLLDRFVAVLHPDSRGDAEAAQSQAVRLLTVNGAVALIGGPDPASEERLCRLAQQYRRPLLTPVWLPTAILAPYAFSIGPVPAEQGQILGRFALEKLQVAQTALLLDNRCAGCVALAESFAQAVGPKAVAFRGEFTSSDQFAELAQQTVAVDPGAILIACSSGDLEKLRNALQAARLRETVPLIFGGPDDGNLSSLADRWARSTTLYWSTLFVTDSDCAKASEFSRQFKERFGRPPEAAEALAYDALHILVEALRRAQTTQGEKIRKELAGLKDFAGVTGTITFDQGQAGRRPIYVIQRQNGQRKTVWKPTAPKE